MAAVLCYACSALYSVFLWRRGFQRDDRFNYLILLAGFALHTTAMVLRGLRLQQCPVTNLYETTVFATWTILAVYLGLGLRPQLRFLGAFAAPVLLAIGVFALMPQLDFAKGATSNLPMIWTSLHAASIALAYGAFGLSFIAALMFLRQESSLKLRKPQAVFSLLPPIQRLEAVVGRLLVAGFVLLTAGLAIGAVAMALLDNLEAYRGDPKVIWSALVWLIYLGLIVMRWKFAQAGRRFALGAVGSFAFVLLTFWGSNLLSTLHNP